MARKKKEIEKPLLTSEVAAPEVAAPPEIKITQREVTPQKDAAGEWVIPDQDDIETYIKNIPTNYAGEPIHVEESGLSYKFVGFAQKKNDERLPTIAERQTGQRIANKLAAYIKQEESKADQQLSPKIQILEEAESQTERLRQAILSVQQNLSREDRRKFASTEVTKTIKAIHELLEKVSQGWETIENKIVKIKAPPEEAEIYKRVAQLRARLENLKTLAWKSNPQFLSKPPIDTRREGVRTLDEIDKSTLPSIPGSKFTPSSFKRTYNPETGRYTDDRYITEVGESTSASSFQRLADDKIGSRGRRGEVAEPSAPTKRGSRLQSKEDSMHIQKPGTEGAPVPPAEGIPEDVRKEFEKEYTEYLLAKASKGAADEAVKQADEKLKKGEEILDKTSPSFETRNEILLEAYRSAYTQLLDNLRSAYIQEAQGKPDATSAVAVASKAFSSHGKEFNERFREQAPKRPEIRREVYDAVERQILDDLRKGIQADAKVLDNPSKLAELRKKTDDELIKTNTRRALGNPSYTPEMIRSRSLKQIDTYIKNLRDELESKSKRTKTKPATSAPEPIRPEPQPKTEVSIERAIVSYDEKNNQWLESGEEDEVILGSPPNDLNNEGGLAWIKRVETPVPGSREPQTQRYFATEEEIETGKPVSEPPEKGVPSPALAPATAAGEAVPAPAATAAARRENFGKYSGKSMAELEESPLLPIAELLFNQERRRGLVAMFLVKTQSMTTSRTSADAISSSLQVVDLLEWFIKKHPTTTQMRSALFDAIAAKAQPNSADPKAQEEKQTQYQQAVTELLTAFDALQTNVEPPAAPAVKAEPNERPMENSAAALDRVYTVRYDHYLKVMEQPKYEKFPTAIKEKEARRRATIDRDHARQLLEGESEKK